MQVQDVKPDGNCGFRAVSVCRGYDEDQWPTIPMDLLQELQIYKEEYKTMFGVEDWVQTYKLLNFFRTDMDTPMQHWMCMLEMGVLIASKYNVILHVLTNAGSMTYLPLRSSPPAWYEHVAIAIGHVNNNHYVKVVLTGGYPMPTIMPQWVHFKYDCAIS